MAEPSRRATPARGGPRRGGADATIRAHYREVAKRYGDSPASTMEDAVIRAREIEAIVSVVGALKAATPSGPLRVLDLGCGNGYALETLASAHPRHRYTGLDFSADMLALARRRGLRGCRWRRGDARALPFPAASFDVVYTERCLINILDRRGQERALREIHRVLAPGGHYLMIECFTDGLAALNRARTECGLEALPEAHHNRYFDKPAFRRAVAPLFDVVEPAAFAALPPANFLSSHYFAARALHPLVTRGAQVRNTEFVKFFSHLPPYGEYAPLQIYLLRALAPGDRRRGRHDRRRERHDRRRERHDRRRERHARRRGRSAR